MLLITFRRDMRLVGWGEGEGRVRIARKQQKQGTSIIGRDSEKPEGPGDT